MAGFKKKKVAQKETPKDRYVAQAQDPDSFYRENPAWGFNSCDKMMWSFTSEHIGSTFWTEIFAPITVLLAEGLELDLVVVR